jgi:predicted PurR-regulated permease PerM
MKFNTRYFLALIPLLLLGLILYFFSDIVTYIVLAWVLSMIGRPFNGFLRRSKYIGKNLGAALTLIFFALLFNLVVWLFIPPIVQQARNLAGIDYTSMIQSLEEPINDWQDWLVEKNLLEDQGNNETNIDSINAKAPYKIPETQLVQLDSLIRDSDSLGANIGLFITLNHPNDKQTEFSSSETEITVHDNFFDRLRKNLFSFLDPSLIPELFGSFVGFLGNLIIAIMSIFFISFFFIREQGLFINILKAFAPNEYEGQVTHAIDDITNLLRRYFVGVAVQMTIITLFVSITLSIFGIKNALLIGFFAAIMNIIPYLGPIIGATFGVIITISSYLELPFYSEMLPLLITVMAVFAVMQMLDNFILQPNIFGKSVKAHPLEIFVVVLAGAQIGGILGMILAIPSYTVLRVVAKVFLSEFKVVQKITRSLEK